MRDPNRIEPMLDALREMWTRWPDMRLGQIVAALTQEMPAPTFYVEDDELLKALRAWILDDRRRDAKDGAAEPDDAERLFETSIDGVNAYAVQVHGVWEIRSDEPGDDDEDATVYVVYEDKPGVTLSAHYRHECGDTDLMNAEVEVLYRILQRIHQRRAAERFMEGGRIDA